MSRTTEGLGAGTAVLPADTVELKAELKTLVGAILGEGEDGGVEAIDGALRILDTLRDLKSKPISDCSSAIVVPRVFRCPISKKIMSDPVILATGQTYDRIHIQRWLNEGNRTCPETKEVLSHTVLTPNYLVRDLITQWCKGHKIEPPKPACDTDEPINDSDRNRLNLLLHKISSSSLADQKESAKELRRLTKRVPSFRTLFVAESSDFIARLLSPLSSGSPINSHPDIQEDLITTVLNISIPEENKSLVAANPVVIPLLTNSLTDGTMETRRNAAAALFTLSAIDSNKGIIVHSNALKPLIDLLDERGSLGMKDAASAIFSLCTVSENRERAVHAGVIRVVMKKIKEGVFVDESLSLLALVSTSRLAVQEMGDLGAIPLIFFIMREASSLRTSENCVVVLYNICDKDWTKLSVVREEENDNPTLAKLVRHGTDRAKRKAQWILQRLMRSISMNSHTA